MSALRLCFTHPQRALRRAAHAHTCRRAYSTDPGAGKSAHATFYSDLLPGMIPVAILGSAVYLGLQLTQTTLSHDKYLEEARARVTELEAEVEALQRERAGRVQGDASSRPTQNGTGDGQSKGWAFGWHSRER